MHEFIEFGTAFDWRVNDLNKGQEGPVGPVFSEFHGYCAIRVKRGRVKSVEDVQMPILCLENFIAAIVLSFCKGFDCCTNKGHREEHFISWIPDKDV